MVRAMPLGTPAASYRRLLGWAYKDDPVQEQLLRKIR
jgi:hypothetical protein